MSVTRSKTKPETESASHQPLTAGEASACPTQSNAPPAPATVSASAQGPALDPACLTVTLPASEATPAPSRTPCPGSPALPEGNPPPPGMDPVHWAVITNTQAVLLDFREEMRGQVGGLEEKVRGLESREEEHSSLVKELRTEVSALREEMTDLRGAVLRGAVLDDRHGADIIKLKTHSMKNNIIFSIKGEDDQWQERPGEDCAEKVRLFCSQVLRIPNMEKVYIQTAHRLGQRTQGRSRSIIACIPTSKDQISIMKNTNRLRDTQHFISKQLAPELKERKDFALPEFIGKKRSGQQVKLVNEKLYVDGKLQTKYIAPPSPPVCTGSTETNLYTSSTREDSGSVFQGVAANLSSPADAPLTLASAMRHPSIARATHIVHAYRTGTHENFSSDGDHGVGWELLKFMRQQNMNNILLIATRTCGPNYLHIGGRRIRHVTELCAEAVTRMKDT